MYNKCKVFQQRNLKLVLVSIGLNLVYQNSRQGNLKFTVRWPFGEEHFLNVATIKSQIVNPSH